jgi:hypothetical protein
MGGAISRNETFVKNLTKWHHRFCSFQRWKNGEKAIEKRENGVQSGVFAASNRDRYQIAPR